MSKTKTNIGETNLRSKEVGHDFGIVISMDIVKLGAHESLWTNIVSCLH